MPKKQIYILLQSELCKKSISVRLSWHSREKAYSRHRHSTSTSCFRGNVLGAGSLNDVLLFQHFLSISNKLFTSFVPLLLWFGRSVSSSFWIICALITSSDFLLIFILARLDYGTRDWILFYIRRNTYPIVQFLVLRDGGGNPQCDGRPLLPSLFLHHPLQRPSSTPAP